MIQLQNKVALVTGATQGVGPSICRLLSRHGARVIVADQHEHEAAELVAELDDESMFRRLSVVEKQDWLDLVEDANALWGGIDILVNNAALLLRGAIVDTELAAMELMVQTNLIGTFFGVKVVGGAMIARGLGGAIVNMGSVEILRGANVRGLTMTAAVEFGPHRIRVNSVYAGAESDGAGVPLKRGPLPDEIARVCIFLASDAASYVNGVEIAVDGGASAAAYTAAHPGALPAQAV